MKKWIFTAAVIAYGVFMATYLVRHFVISDALCFYAEKPQRVLLITSIGLAGGLVAAVFGRLSARVWRFFILGIYTVMIVGTTAVLGYALFVVMHDFSRFPVPDDVKDIFVILPVSICGFSALWWQEFRQRHGVLQNNHKKQRPMSGE